VPLVGEGHALKNAHRRKESPAVHEPGLAWRQSCFFDRNDPVIVKDQPMNQKDLARWMA
jgi:hypothetical protein